jgi:hypothetical protein
VPLNRRAAVAARIFGSLVLLVVAFQLALAAGAPWGAFAMGGAYPGQLPTAMRVVAVIQALMLLAFGAIVAARAGLMLSRWHSASRYLIWLVIAYAVVGSVLNVITPSAVERAVWLPVVLTLGICAILVARSPGS